MKVGPLYTHRLKFLQLSLYGLNINGYETNGYDMLGTFSSVIRVMGQFALMVIGSPVCLAASTCLLSWQELTELLTDAATAARMPHCWVFF